MLKRIVIGLVVLVAAAQAVPIERSNPPVETEIDAPPDVRTVLERSCWNCHSNETTWPWYAYVAPVSWLVAHDVHEAREHMNFSTWNRYDADDVNDYRHDIWEEVEDGEMPLPVYLLMHPEAELDDAARDTLRTWSESGPPVSGSGHHHHHGESGADDDDGDADDGD